MTRGELATYLAECNRQSVQWRLTRPCSRCGKPITGDVVLHLKTNPPGWFHPECAGVDQ